MEKVGEGLMRRSPGGAARPPARTWTHATSRRRMGSGARGSEWRGEERVEGSGVEGLDNVGGGVGGEAWRWADGRVGGTPSAAATGEVGHRAAGGWARKGFVPTGPAQIMFLFIYFSFFSASSPYFSFENMNVSEYR